MVDFEVRWIELLSSDRAGLEKLATQMDIHPLAVEDCLNRNQRAKFEDFEKHQLLVWFVFIKGEIYELEFIVFPSTVLLVTNEPPPEGNSWKEYFKISPVHRDSDHMLYQALDKALDISASNVRPLFLAIDEFEESLLKKPADLHALFDLKRQLSRAELALSFLSSVVGQWQHFLNPKNDLRWRLRDLWDHCERLHRALIFHRTQISSTMDMYWGVTARRTNDKIKKLTLVASISVPLTFWTSFWGMNFSVIPFHSKEFFLIAIVLMGISILGVYLFLKRKGFWQD